MTIYGPTLPDLRIRYDDSSVADISVSLGTRNIGLLLGSLVGGIVNDRFLDRTNLVMSLGLALSGSCVLLAPWGAHLWVLGILCFAQGVGQGLCYASKCWYYNIMENHPQICIQPKK